jgi:predicted ATPase
LLLLEEPELSLNEGIVRQIAPLIFKMQRDAKHRRQVWVTTHSEALLSNPGIDPAEVVRLEPTSDGTQAHATSTADIDLIRAGYSIAEVLLPKIRPANVDQLSLFGT